MSGRGRSIWLLGWTLGALLVTLPSCHKEDVAPPQAKPASDGWDDTGRKEERPPEGGAEAPSAAAPAPGAGEPGVPGVPPDERLEPKPGTPEQPPPPPSGPNGEMPPPPEGGEIPMGAPPLPEGVKGVKLKGTVIYPDYKSGLIQIDVADKSSQHGQKGVRPKVIQLYRMEKPGPFELDVPENQGDIWISAYNDADSNGRPSREEPRGNASGNPFKVGAQEVTGVEIKLEKEKIPPPP